MSASTVIIREASEADIPGILAIYAEPDLDHHDVLSPEGAKAVIGTMRRYPWFKQFVAEDGGRIVGTFALLVMDNLAHNGQRSALAEQVAVAADRRSEGIGEMMMDHACKLAAAEGCYKLALSSNLKREAAHRFYDRLGFTRHGYSFLIELPEAARP